MALRLDIKMEPSGGLRPATSGSLLVGSSDPGFTGSRERNAPRFGGGRTLIGRGPSRQLVGADGRPLNQVEPDDDEVEEHFAGPGKEIHAPKWLNGIYRPRRLSEEGYEALVSLGPGGKGVFPNQQKVWSNLVEREAFLIRRYAALDLMMRGLAFEANGRYHHVEKLGERNRLKLRQSLELSRTGEDFDEELLMAWLAVYRRASMDQLYAIDPTNAFGINVALGNLEAGGYVQADYANIGKGRLETYGISKKAWKHLKQQWPEADARGLGPRKLLPQNREYHESVLADALGYFTHEIKDYHGEIDGVWLDRALRWTNPEAKEYRDFRLEFVNSIGIGGVLEVEVVGIGSSYRERTHAAKKAASVGSRSFDASGRLDVRGSQNVSIGR